MKFFWPSAVFFCAFLSAAPVFAGDWTFLPVEADDESFAESYTAVTRLTNGTYVLQQLLFTNAGFGNQKPACRVLVVPPEGKPWNRAERGDSDDWSFDPGKNALKAHDCTFRGGGAESSFATNMDSRKVHVRTPVKLRSVKDPEGRIEFDEGYFESTVLLAWAPSKISFSGKGMERYDGTGVTYLEYTRSVGLMKDLTPTWIRFRNLGEEGSRSLLQVRNVRGKLYQGWHWKDGVGKPNRTGPLKVQRKQTRGQESLELEGGAVRGHIVSTRLLFTYRPVEEYGVVGALAKTFIGNPVVKTFEAVWTWPDGRTESGILETMDLDD